MFGKMICIIAVVVVVVVVVFSVPIPMLQIPTVQFLVNP